MICYKRNSTITVTISIGTSRDTIRNEHNLMERDAVWFRIALHDTVENDIVQTHRIRPVFKSSIWKNGSRPWEI